MVLVDLQLSKVRLNQDQARDCPSVSIEHQLKPQTMPTVAKTGTFRGEWAPLGPEWAPP
jgi:hypothetical protein